MKMMKWAGLMLFGVMAVPLLAIGQIPYSGTYTFDGATGNTNDFTYNGDPIPGLIVGNLSKSGVTSSSSTGNFRANNWALDTVAGALGGDIDPAKYFEFTLTAEDGYTFDMSSLSFGVGRSSTGPRSFQWRSSIDSFSSSFTNYSAANAALTVTDVGLTYTADGTTSATGNELDLVSVEMTGITNITLRFYGYNSEQSGGTAGLQGPFTFSVVVNAPEGAPAVIITTPSSSVPFETASIDIEGTANEFTLGDLSWSNSLTGVSGSVPASANWSIAGVALDVGANVITVSGTNELAAVSQSSVTITRNDVVPTNVQFASSSAFVAEASQVYTVTVVKTIASGLVSGEVTIGGTATEGQDFTINTTNFVMDGEVTNATLEITIIDDAEEEAAETIVLGLANVVGGTIGSPSEFTLTINGNDGVVRPVIISQYYEGTSNNKWIELFNPGDEAVNLSAGGYRLGLWSNANREGWKTNATPNSSAALTGTIAPGGTYLVGNASAINPSYAVVDQTSGVCTFTGDDSVLLYIGTSYDFANVIDVFGVTTNIAPDQSFVRKSTVTAGVNTDVNTNDWEILALADVDNAIAGTNPYLGFHSLGDTPPPVDPALQDIVAFSVSGGIASVSVGGSESGVSYILTYSDSLLNTNPWAFADGPFNGTGAAIFPFEDTTATNAARFYRIELAP